LAEDFKSNFKPLKSSKMEARLSILFYGKKTKLDSNKTLSVYLRVTINGERFEVSTQRYVESGKWSTSAGKVKGNSELEERKHTLVEVFTYHNEQMKALIGKSCSKATHRKYRTTLDHTIAFLEWKFKRSDIEISNIGYSFITDFEFWLKSIQNCNHNTTIKYLSNLRKIIYVCLKNGWLIRDPFFGFKMTKKEVIREILTKEELQTLISKEIQNTRIRQVRDIFIFSCFTGLAYIDTKRLKRSEIVIGMDGERWIYTQRKKTDSPTKIPLLPVVLEIMEVYKDHPQCVCQGHLLPVLSNSKMNAYLKEVADICSINKHLTFHIARHTFATIVTLNNGVPIESVSNVRP
jgi:integrase